MPSLSLYVNLLFFNQARLWPESKIKRIASWLSWHRCCLSNKQSWGRAEYATANSVSSPTINVFPLNSLLMAITIWSLMDRVTQVIRECPVSSSARQWFCLLSWVFPVFLRVAHWFLPDLYLIRSLVLFKVFPNSLLDFHFFIQVFPQDFGLLMEKDEGKYCKIPAATDSATATDLSAAWIRPSCMSYLHAEQTTRGLQCEERLRGKGYSCLQAYV